MKSQIRKRIIYGMMFLFVFLAGYFLLGGGEGVYGAISQVVGQGIPGFIAKWISPTTYTVSGRVFNDLNKNKLFAAGEEYTAGITITSTGGTVTVNNSTGEYTVSGLTAGTYTISYTSLPSGSGYKTVYPVGTPPSFVVTVGPGCSVDSTTGASCQ